MSSTYVGTPREKFDKLRMGTACYHVLHSVPPVVAHEMNFFYDEGLVDEYGRPAYEMLKGGIVPFNAERDAVAQAMKERGAGVLMDVHPSTIVYLNARMGGDLRIIAGWRNAESNLVFAQPEIEDVNAARGKVVGLKDFGNNRYHAWAAALRRYDHDPDDYEYVRGIQDGIVALEDRVVDVAFVPQDQRSDALELGYNIMYDLGKEFPVHPTRVIACTQELIDARPEWVAAFVKAIIRSYVFIRTMPENLDYLSNLERRLRIGSADLDERHSDYLACSTAERCERMPFPIDGIPRGLQEYLQTKVEAGQLDPSDLDHLEESVDLSFAEAGYEELRAREELAGDFKRVEELVARFGN